MRTDSSSGTRPSSSRLTIDSSSSIARSKGRRLTSEFALLSVMHVLGRESLQQQYSSFLACDVRSCDACSTCNWTFIPLAPAKALGHLHICTDVTGGKDLELCQA